MPASQAVVYMAFTLNTPQANTGPLSLLSSFSRVEVGGQGGFMVVSSSLLQSGAFAHTLPSLMGPIHSYLLPKKNFSEL